MTTEALRKYIPWMRKPRGARGRIVQTGVDWRALLRVARRAIVPTLVTVVAISILVPAWRWASDPATFPVTRLVVEGEFLNVTQDQVKRHVMPHLGEGFFGFDVAAVRDAVHALPWVHWVDVERQWPGTIRIRVIEQQAIARWEKGGLINTRGELFTPETSTYPKGLPQLVGPAHSYAQVAAQYEQLARLLVKVNLHVVELQLDDRRAWTAVLSNGLRLVLGRHTDRARLQRFIRVYPKSLAMRIHDVAQIDLRYPNGFAVRWREDASTQPQGKLG